MKDRIVWGSLLLACLCSGAAGQSVAPDPGATTASVLQEDIKLPGILPIYHFSPTLKSYQPLTPIEKFRIATDDSIAPGTFVLAG